MKTRSKWGRSWRGQCIFNNIPVSIFLIPFIPSLIPKRSYPRIGEPLSFSFFHFSPFHFSVSLSISFHAFISFFLPSFLPFFLSFFLSAFLFHLSLSPVNASYSQVFNFKRFSQSGSCHEKSTVEFSTRSERFLEPVLGHPRTSTLYCEVDGSDWKRLEKRLIEGEMLRVRETCIWKRHI